MPTMLIQSPTFSVTITILNTSYLFLRRFFGRSGGVGSDPRPALRVIAGVVIFRRNLLEKPSSGLAVGQHQGDEKTDHGQGSDYSGCGGQDDSGCPAENQDEGNQGDDGRYNDRDNDHDCHHSDVGAAD